MAQAAAAPTTRARPASATRWLLWVLAMVPVLRSWRFVFEATGWPAGRMHVAVIVGVAVLAVVRWPRAWAAVVVGAALAHSSTTDNRIGVSSQFLLSQIGLLVAAGLALTLTARHPRRGVPVLAAIAVAMVALSSVGLGVRFAFLVLGWGWLVAVTIGVHPAPPRLSRAALVPSAALGGAAMAALWFQPLELRLPLVLSAAAAGIAAAVAASPTAATRLARLGAPVLRGVDAAVVVIDRPVAAIVSRTHRGLRHWTSGATAPAGPWIDDDMDERGSLWWPTAVWAAALAAVSLAVYDGSRPFIGSWMKWDATRYLRIAELGYQYEPGRYIDGSGELAPVAWFPGYGLAIRAVEPLLGSYTGAAFALTLASGLAATILLWTWLADQRVALVDRRLSIVLFVVFPWCFMLYGAGWSDAFVVALTLGAFVLLGRDRPVAAGLLAAAALLARPNAIALPLAAAATIVGGWLVARWPGAFPRSLSEGRERTDLRALARDRRWPVVLLPLAALAGFVAWCWVAYDEPLLYWNARNQVYRVIGFDQFLDVTKATFPGLIDARISEDPRVAANRVAGALVVVAVLWSLPVIRRRFGWLATSFCGITLGIIWVSSTDFIGAGRYSFVAFPAFAAWAGWLRGRRALTAIVVLAFLAGQLLLAQQYTSTVDLGW